MPITIKEIAELAGTSRGTVDRVLNNRGNVKQELADKINAILKEHHYTPNTTAKMLVASQKKVSIGVVINSVGNSYFDDVLKGIQKASKKWKSNVNLILKELRGYEVQDQIQAIDELVKEGVKAIAITPVDSVEISNRLNELINSGIQVAFINSDLEDVNRLLMVGANNKQSGRIAGNLANLILKKSSKIAIVTGSYSNTSNKKRILGFKEAVSKSDKSLQIVDIIENKDCDIKSKEIVTKLINGDMGIDFIYFCAGGISGGLEAINEAKSKVKAITVDCSARVKTALKEGVVYATITQDPNKQGFIPVDALAELLVLGKYPNKGKIHTENRIIVTQHIE